MPAVSKKQRRAMAIAEHDPGALFPENKGLAKMSTSQLHDFAVTKEKGLPTQVKAKHESKKEVKRGFGSEKRSDHGRHKRGRGDSMT
jgi:hypothetical protein